MKEFIYTNYGFKVDKIYNNYFFVGNEKVLIFKIKDKDMNIDKLFKLTNEMFNNKLFVDTFLINKDNSCFTMMNNDIVILLKVNDRANEVTLDYLFKYFKFKIDIIEFDIVKQFENRIDDIELSMMEYNKEHPLLQNSINYFIGCSENAITLLNEYEKKVSYDIAHNINYYNYNMEEFNNPFNFIRLNKMYDLSLYIKYNFYNDKLDYDELYEILKSIDNEYDEVFLFSCLLYRNYYFDVVDEIIKGDEIDDKLLLFINKVRPYEELLSYCKDNMKKSKLIQLINWFN